ncbi:hypothetical protein [Bdellovibrio bacteriovorus]|uniref:Uncharacterized protein n=1 Tax=Bdellovibrio bacteriovorus TaxID=959 RepID=A0A1Z3N912_BDEBC|nr:hypothetical protein [Bdellovibrio bacteriovorus]ASD63962.1 hypothetical protein B9G79_10470 [Bdellovibrio bacteriovorus]
MQIGKLKEENVELLENHSGLGFANKTKMLDFAMDLLREKMKRERRRKEREQLLEDYSKSSVEHYFKALDGEDFE